MAHRADRADDGPGAGRSASRRHADSLPGTGPVGPPERGPDRRHTRVLRRRNHVVRRAYWPQAASPSASRGAGCSPTSRLARFSCFLRPFKVGDLVNVGGVTGVVDAIGLFGTTLNTPDNVMTIIGNNKIFSDTIQNFSANPYRRIDLTTTINHAVDHRVATRLSEGAIGPDPERVDEPRASRRDPPVHAGRAVAVRQAVRQQPALLAGLLRHEPGDPRIVRRSGLSGAGPGLCGDGGLSGPAVGRSERPALTR